MALSSTLLDTLRDLGIAVTVDAPLVKQVFWRAGGVADALLEVTTRTQLMAVQRHASAAGVPVFPLGNGSNLLVADAGIRGIVVRLKGELADTRASDRELIAGGGLRLAVLLARARKHRWGGLEALGGIPGTVGGAVRMNAGTSLGEIGDLLVDVEIVSRSGMVHTLPKHALRLGYRTCELPAGSIVTRAHMTIDPEAYEASEATMRAFLERRKATQPLDMPSCGSTFRNPEGDHAGRLIEAAGLKGYTVGGARVSHKHANFVVNTGDATAADIRAVIEHVQAEVARRSGVTLQREVEFVGAW